MTRRRSDSPTSGATSSHIRERLERARTEGRFQAALELARQLFKQEPTPAHRELVKEITLARADEFLARGNRREAAVTFQNARSLDPLDAVWLGRIAGGLARSGEVRAALEIHQQLPEGTVSAGTFLGSIADAALELEDAGRELLTAALQAEFDCIRTAFQQVEEGQDEPARETLQAIGLRSPFLEWKLLLRGLQAYYQHDDGRALENWTRLSSGRLPARLAAPFRAHLDAGFRASQPAATQNVLQRQFDQLQGMASVQLLRAVQVAQSSRPNLAGVLRKIEGLLPALRVEAPALVPRLAKCMYWSIIDSGPDDIERYRRVFGPPADDPQFNRLQALGYEKNGEVEGAHAHWQKYEQDLSTLAATWPAGEANHARALVWQHMGEEALAVPTKEDLQRLPRFLRDDPRMPASLKPSAEECFSRALQLNPDLVAAREKIFRLHLRKGQVDKAQKVARAALERLPEHPFFLEELGDLCLKSAEPSEGLGFLQRALHANPLNRKLRNKLAFAHMLIARDFSLAKQFAEARVNYETALSTLTSDEDKPSLLFRWAASELKAGQLERAEELLQQARAAGGTQLFLVYGMLTEVGRLKLPKAAKDRFGREFTELLAAPIDPEAAARMILYHASMKGMERTYPGMKTHEKKILDYIKRAKTADFTERQHRLLLDALVEMQQRTLTQHFVRKAQKVFPHCPHFALAEARSLCDRQDEERIQTWKVEPLLTKARRLAEALPGEDPEKEEFLEAISRMELRLKALNPFGTDFLDDLFGFGGRGNGADFDDDDDDDDDDFDDDF